MPSSPCSKTCPECHRLVSRLLVFGSTKLCFKCAVERNFITAEEVNLFPEKKSEEPLRFSADLGGWGFI